MRTHRNRLLLHIGFWIVYFSITFFNELYLTSDFTAEATINGLSRTFLAEFNLLCIKMALVYYTIYSFIPRWLKSEKRRLLTAEGVTVLIGGLFIYRAVIQYINWQLIFHEVPRELSRISIIARYLYSLLDLLQIIGITAAVKLFTLRIAAVQQEKELVRQKMRSELLHLKAQINPHFLFNTLNSIYALSKIRSERTPDVVNRLSLLLRYMLYESEKAQTSVEDETRIINDYIELQQLRFDNRVRITKQINLDNPLTPITPLLILPLVENAYKHGVGVRGDDSFINIDIRLTDRLLTVCIENSIALESIKLNGYDGIGLTNISRQLQLLYRDYDFSTSQGDDCFKVTLKINTSSYVGIELFDSRG